eukprot:PhF_6_TR38905/c0_g1_i2/m.58196
MASDWEKEYEEDLRRMREGQDIQTTGRRIMDDDGGGGGSRAPPASAPNFAPQVPSSPALERSATVDIVTPPSASRDDPLQWPEVPTRQQLETRERGKTLPTTNSGAGPMLDPRLGLPWVTLPSKYASWTKKFSERIFTFDEVQMYEPGMISKSKTARVCVTCPNAIYMVVPSTGAITHAAVIYFLKEIWIVKESQIVLRDAEQPNAELWFDFGGDGGIRQSFIKVIKMLAAYNSKDITVFPAPSPRVNMSSKPSPWPIVEDPRSGLTVIPLPGEHLEAFAPLYPKILHYFGFCELYEEDWKSSWVTKKRAIWITATSIFFSDVSGPGDDGRHIKRCLAIEFIGEIVDGPGGIIGLKMAGGPPQPDVAFVLDSIGTKEAVLFVIRQIYKCRVPKKVVLDGPPITCPPVRRVDKHGKEGLSPILAIKLPKQFTVELFRMRTKDELVQLLMVPVDKMDKVK